MGIITNYHQAGDWDTLLEPCVYQDSSLRSRKSEKQTKNTALHLITKLKLLPAWNMQTAILGTALGLQGVKSKPVYDWNSCQWFLLIKLSEIHQRIQTAPWNFPTVQGNLLLKLLGSLLPVFPTVRRAIPWLRGTWLKENRKPSCRQGLDWKSTPSLCRPISLSDTAHV